MKKLRFLPAIIAVIIFISSCQKANPFDPLYEHGNSSGSDRVALDWYKLQLRFLLERNTSMNGVYFGYLGIGLYESVRNGIGTSVSFAAKLYQMPAMPVPEKNQGYYWPESANAAMANMIRSFNTGLTTANLVSIDSLENFYSEKFKTQTSTNSFERSKTFGKNIAADIYNWSLTDNFNPTNIGYMPPVFDGAWVPTPPAFANGVMPYLSTTRPFLLADRTALAPPFPVPYSEDPGSDYYKMAKNVYDVFQTLTQEQKDIALYYVDQGNGRGYTPAGHDFSVVIQALEKLHANLAMEAEIFAKAGISEREATIVCFKSKYIYNLIRPVSYIQKVIDPKWLPFITTPPHPEYPAAHAFITGTVMQAITTTIGSETAITDHTYDFLGFAPRTHVSLNKSAQEAGISRLYGGIHYLPSINIGLSLAQDLGKRIGDIKLHDSIHWQAQTAE